MCTSFPDDPVPLSFHTILCAGVENVINFDFPPTSNDYVHRVGRYVIIIIIIPCTWIRFLSPPSQFVNHSS